MRIALLVAALLLSAPAAAQDKTIKFIVGFPAGAGLDTMTRLVAERMHVTLGQPVVVENRPGADGRIAMDLVKAAPPDGLTLVMTPLVTVVTAPQVFSNLRYDPFADFAPVAHAAGFLFAFSVGPAVPAKTPKDAVDRLAAAIGEAIKSPDVREKLEALGMEPTGYGPAELARIHKADYDKWGPVIRASGFKPEN